MFNSNQFHKFFSFILTQHLSSTFKFSVVSKINQNGGLNGFTNAYFVYKIFCQKKKSKLFSINNYITFWCFELKGCFFFFPWCKTPNSHAASPSGSYFQTVFNYIFDVKRH